MSSRAHVLSLLLASLAVGACGGDDPRPVAAENPVTAAETVPAQGGAATSSRGAEPPEDDGGSSRPAGGSKAGSASAGTAEDETPPASTAKPRTSDEDRDDERRRSDGGTRSTDKEGGASRPAKADRTSSKSGGNGSSKSGGNGSSKSGGGGSSGSEGGTSTAGGGDVTKAQARALLVDYTERISNRDPSLCTEILTLRRVEELTKRKGDAAIAKCKEDISRAEVKTELDEITSISSAGDRTTVKAVLKVIGARKVNATFELIEAGGRLRIDGGA